MSSRFPPTSSDSRYPPRGHTPPGFDDRRSAAPYGSNQSSRANELSYRGNAAHAHSGPARDIPRDPPRGPKAALDGGRGGGFAPRGRGFIGRGELRDTRDASFQRRDDSREWPPRRESFESRDRRPSPVSRNRSRTPPIRDFREPRDVPPGHLDLSRVRRGSRDGPLSASSSVSEAPSSAGFYGRGGYRGRGRGDWDFRGRGRGNYADDRDAIRPRSRSRDRMWDRDARDDRLRDHDRDPGRREEDKRYPKEERDREPDRYRKDVPFQRPDSRNSGGSHTRASTPHSVVLGPPNPNSLERPTFKSNVTTGDGLRRQSTIASGIESTQKDDSRLYQSAHRPEQGRNLTGTETPSSPPQPTQVPAFGSLSYRGLSGNQSNTSSTTAIKDETPPSAPARFEVVDPVRVAPKAPKAELAQAQPPTGPKAGTPFARRPQAVGAASPARGPLQSGNSSIQSPAAPRFGAPQRPASSQYFPPASSTPGTQSARTTNPRIGFDNGPRPGHLESSAARVSSHEQPTYSNQSDLQMRGNSGAALSGSPVRIPRGPKANTQPSIRAPMAPRLGHNTWVNPNLRPSIMNTVPPTAVPRVPAKRDYTGEERASKQTDDQSMQESTHHSARLKAESEQLRAHVQEAEDPLRDGAELPPRESLSLHGAMPAPESATGINSQGTSGSDDDDGMDLDEDDFEEGEKQFSREMQRLDAKRPPTPRHHAELLPLLEEIDALASAAEDLANGVLPDFNEPEESLGTSIPLGLPSPKSEGVVNEQLETDETEKKEDYVTAESPPLSEANLPFLISGPPTPFSEISVVRENYMSYDHIKDRILECFKEDRERLNVDYDDMRAEYARLYKQWRLGLEMLEQERSLPEETNGATPSPVPAEPPVVNVLPVVEVRRAGRSSNNVSEYEFQKVLEISAKETAEAEEIREKKALENQALADLQKEAAIPDMLSLYEMGSTIFIDTNNLIPNRMALEVLAFDAPKAPFTGPVQQELFENLYIHNPKRWTLIAKQMGGEYDYQDCIHHYYVTKIKRQYKFKVNKMASKKSGKGGRGKGRGKPNAIMSGRLPMYDGNEEDAPPPSLTEAGRPRRAVAPVFGGKDSVTESDPATPVPTPGRRGAGQNRLDTGGDSTSERPTVKRTRTAQREKGTKRGRALLLAAAPATPSKNDSDLIRAKSKEPKVEDQQRPIDLDELKGPTGSELGPPPNRGGWLSPTRSLDNPSVVDVAYGQPPPPPMLQQQPPPPQQQLNSDTHSRAPQTSSYWSVPEQQDFRKLVDHYGTDWQQISQALKTKTHIMVKNHYFREVEKGNTELERMADQADQRIKRGEQTGNPPQPSLVQRRRPEPTPHNVPHRALAPNTETLDAVIGSPSFQSNGSSQVSPPHHGQVAPRLAPLLQAGASNGTGTLQPTSQNTSAANVPIQSSPQSQRSSQPLQGPRAGFFPTDRSSQASILPGSAGRPHVVHENHPSHHHHQPQEQQPGKRIDADEFAELVARQHRAAHAYPQEPVQYNAPGALKARIHQPNPLLQPRTSSAVSAETERKPRVAAHQQQSPTDPSPPALRRLDSLGQVPYPPSHAQSPQTGRPLIMSPPQELARPSSVPASVQSTNIQPPQRPVPPPAKRSNIMSILNDEPADPQPRKSLNEHRVAAPTPPPQSPALSAQIYQQPGQPLPQFPRREPVIEASQAMQQLQQPEQQGRMPYAQPPQQMHPQIQQQQQQAQQQAHQQAQQQAHQQAQQQAHQQAQQQAQQQAEQHKQQMKALQQQMAQQQRVSQHRENGRDWPAAVQRSFLEQRGPFQSQQPMPISPHAQPAFVQPSSRPSFPPLQPTRVPSPPLPAQTHSRASSYSALHPNPNQQQGIPLQNSQPLQPSPWASLKPRDYPSQLPAHPQQPQPQQPRPQSAFSMTQLQQHELLVRQQQEDAMRQDMQRQEMQNLRQQETMRMHQERESQRQHDLLRIGRTYTPPQHPGQGPYGNGPPPPPPPPQQHDQMGKRSRYDDMR
ncbi:hypothetical protein MMC30_001327 [Trapelia coarctata]|nr:hypothetical protein [Trapelia coarctata]